VTSFFPECANTGSDHPNAKLTEDIVIDMRRRHDNGEATTQELADEHGVSYRCAQQAIGGQTWGHV
jgi:hypothetical protein